MPLPYRQPRLSPLHWRLQFPPEVLPAGVCLQCPRHTPLSPRIHTPQQPLSLPRQPVNRQFPQRSALFCQSFQTHTHSSAPVSFSQLRYNQFQTLRFVLPAAFLSPLHPFLLPCLSMQNLWQLQVQLLYPPLQRCSYLLQRLSRVCPSCTADLRLFLQNLLISLRFPVLVPCTPLLRLFPHLQIASVSFP